MNCSEYSLIYTNEKHKEDIHRWKLENRMKVLDYNKDYYRRNKHNGKWKYLKRPKKIKKKPVNTLKEKQIQQSRSNGIKEKKQEPYFVRTYGEYIIRF